MTVRYRIDPQRLAYIQANLPQPVEKELVPPVVATSFREIAPSYLVRELFAVEPRRDSPRGRAASISTGCCPTQLSSKKSCCATFELPAEYAKGWKACCSRSRRTSG